jgi:hypothetical protein
MIATVKRMPVWIGLLIGLACAALGLLPWLVTGMRLPLQNLWGTSTLPERMPIVALPFSQYAITLIIAMLVVGAAAAGIVARALRSRMPRVGVLLILAGVVVAQVAAIVQTASVVGGGLQHRRESELYVVLLCTVAGLAVAVGVATAMLVGFAPRAGAVIGLSIGASAAGPWISGLLNPLGTVPGDVSLAVLGLVMWIPPVLVGAAIAWGGVNTIGRIAAACVGVVLVWIVPALTTGITSAAGTRVLARDPVEMRDYGIQVFFSALTVPELALRPIVLCIAVAVVGLVVRAVVLRRPR